MAGDWIKMRTDLQSHPKVVRILSATSSDKFRAVGGLHAVWGVFDAHSVDGSLHGYTPGVLDHIIGWDGFSGAMIAVGWLAYDGEQTLTLPEFTEHNGKSAKRRADDTKRKKTGRKSDNYPQNVRKISADDEENKRTREEKRREEEKLKEAADAADPIFGTGLALLVRKGAAEKSARGFLGLLRKKVGDDLVVAELLAAAERDDVSDPLAWLTKAADQRAKQKSTGSLFQNAPLPTTPRRREFQSGR